jgi:F-type H+-transporting ATPase subunit c
MDTVSVIGLASIAGAALCMGIGSIGPALGEAKAIAQALASIAQQPDEAGTISRTLFIGLAMIECRDLLFRHRHHSDFRQSDLEPCDRQERSVARADRLVHCRRADRQLPGAGRTHEALPVRKVAAGHR